MTKNKSLLWCILLLGFGSLAEAKNSISDLPMTSQFLIKNLSCQLLSYIPSKEVYFDEQFKISAEASGHNTLEKTFQKGIVSADIEINRQSLKITWKEGSEVIAKTSTWIQSSLNKSLVLFAYRPNNDEEQMSLGCNFNTFEKPVAP